MFSFLKRSNYYFKKMLKSKSKLESFRGEANAIAEVANSRGFIRIGEEDKYFKLRGKQKKLKADFYMYKTLYKKKLEEELGIKEAQEEMEKQFREYGI